MSNIYDQHRAAFRNISAFVIVKGGERIATVAFKFPRDGAGRLWAYVHYFGMPMVRGHAGGYGYDKASAAVDDAIRKIDPDYFTMDSYGGAWDKECRACSDFRNVILTSKDGTDWDSAFRNAGYQVWGVI